MNRLGFQPALYAYLRTFVFTTINIPTTNLIHT